jgi:acyl-CoA thioesterase-1
MRTIGWIMVAAGLLAGCKAEAPAPAPDPAAGDTRDERPVMGPERRILAFGDSLFAGYGLENGESYPARLEAALRARGVNARVVNAGVSGDTTAAGLQRLAFTLDAQEHEPDLALLELGGNDLLRGLPPQQTRQNLEAMLAEIGRRGIPVVLMGMRAPPNAGPDFQAEFDAIYPALAKKHGAALVPFFLESVYDKPALIQPDHVHPTAQGVEAIVGTTAEAVAEALPPPTGGGDQP